MEQAQTNNDASRDENTHTIEYDVFVSLPPKKKYSIEFNFEKDASKDKNMHRCVICGEKTIEISFQIGYGSKFDGLHVCCKCCADVLDPALEAARQVVQISKIKKLSIEKIPIQFGNWSDSWPRCMCEELKGSSSACPKHGPNTVWIG